MESRLAVNKRAIAEDGEDFDEEGDDNDEETEEEEDQHKESHHLLLSRPRSGDGPPGPAQDQQPTISRLGIRRGRKRTSSSSATSSTASSSSSTSPNSLLSASRSGMMDTGPPSRSRQEEYRHRPSWCDAASALRQVKAGEAKGNKVALTLRSYMQRVLYAWGNFVQTFAIPVVIIISLILIIFCIGLKDVSIQTDLVKLWVPTGGRLDEELNYLSRIQAAATATSESSTSKNLSRQRRIASTNQSNTKQEDEEPTNTAATAEDGGDKKKAETGLSGGFQVVIQTPRRPGQTVLSQDELLMHAKMLTDVATMKVNMFGQKWALSDICFKPPAPTVEADVFADMVNDLLERIIPCVFISPLDCFWDGSKPLGPFPPLDLGSLKFLVPSLPSEPLSWKNLDPMAVLKDVGNFGIPLGPIQDLFDRAGIGKAYTDRPCIDPFDPECPETAPNKADVCGVTEHFVAWNNGQPQGSRVSLKKVEQDPKTQFTDDTDGKGTARTDFDNANDGFRGLGDIFGSLLGGAGGDTAQKTTRVCAEYRDAVVRLLAKRPAFVKNLPEVIRPKYLNFGKELTGGCDGFARNVLNWPEEMILGGRTHSGDGMDGTLTKAEAYQSVMMVASPYDVYLRYKGGHATKPNLNVKEWNATVAEEIVAAWQRQFTERIYNMDVNSDQPELPTDQDRQFHPLASTSIGDMLTEFSRFKPTVIIIGYFLMIFYAGLCLGSFRQRGVQSASGLGITGVLLVTFASLAGLGFSTWVGIEFNAATTQIVPFLTLGLGVDDMFLLVHSYQEIVHEVKRNEIGHLLKETGLSVMLTSINNILAFSVGGLLPVPALRSFCFQTAILLFFNMICIITLFPAVISIDIMRRRANRMDILCCFKWNDKVIPSSSATAPTSGNNGGGKEVDNNYGSTTTSASTVASIAQQQAVEDGEAGHHQMQKEPLEQQRGLSKIMKHVGGLDAFVSDYYAPFLSKTPVKIIVLIFFVCLLCFGIYGCALIRLGLELTDVIPTGTAPYAFLRARERYFSFYPMYAVIKSVDFPNKQRQIDEYKRAIARSRFIVKNDGKLGDSYWLPTMRDWLKRMQDDLDSDRNRGLVNETHVLPEATDNAKLAFKLICQKGDSMDCNRMDLADLRKMSRKNKGIKYLVGIIEILSRKAAVIPVKDKRPKTVLEAFYKGISMIGHGLPFRLFTDNGREFFGDFRKTMKELMVTHVFSTDDSTKAAVIERFWRTFKERIFKYLDYKDSKHYLPHIKAVVSAYNNSVHSTTKMRPNDINQNNAAAVWDSVYGKKNRKITKPKFSPGEIVRIQKKTPDFYKGYVAGYSKENFVVTGVHNDGRLYYYTLSDDKDEPILELLRIPRTGLQNNEGVQLLEMMTTYTTDDSDGTVHHSNESIVRRDLFYNAVTAWYRMDDMMYYVTQAAFHPVPPTDFPVDMDNFSQPIPPALPMQYSRIPFFLNGLTDTEETVVMIREIRSICDRFAENGLPNFPEGIPFTFWEQYLHIVVNVLKCVAFITITVFVVISLLLMNPWTAGLIVFVLVNMVVELSGAMGLFALKLNPVSSVSLITAVGIGVEFTVHISVSYLTNMGTTADRLRMTLEHMFAPVLHGGISTFLGIVMLAFSEFTFIVLYFFLVMSTLILLGLLNGLILLPVLLTLIGPPSEVRSLDGSGMVPAPSDLEESEKFGTKYSAAGKQKDNGNPAVNGDKPTELSQISNENNAGAGHQ